MMVAGIAALLAGLVLARTRFRAASGAAKIIVLGPVFEAVALAMFAAEHFTAAHDLMGIVPHWLPGPLFWTYFVGVALLAAAVSFIAWQMVRCSATALAVFFLLIVALVSLPSLPHHINDRFAWILTVRETGFAAGALVLAGSVWPDRASPIGPAFSLAGRHLLGAIMIFYAVEHFLFPLFVPGVPLEKPMPAWMPAPTLFAWLIGLTLLAGGVGLFIRRTICIAAAGAGAMLLLVTAFFYLPIFLMEMHTSLAVEGLNYVGDTLLFASTVLLAGFAGRPSSKAELSQIAG
jgi:uncharacterized membrane protein